MSDLPEGVVKDEQNPLKLSPSSPNQPEDSLLWRATAWPPPELVLMPCPSPPTRS